MWLFLAAGVGIIVYFQVKSTFDAAKHFVREAVVQALSPEERSAMASTMKEAEKSMNPNTARTKDGPLTPKTGGGTALGGLVGSEFSLVPADFDHRFAPNGLTEGEALQMHRDIHCVAQHRHQDMTDLAMYQNGQQFKHQ